MAINSDKLRELAAFVRTNQCQIFNMGDWLTSFDKESEEQMRKAEDYASISPDKTLPENFCGTAGCLAGSFILMERGVDKAVEAAEHGDVSNIARKELGLSERASDYLFTPADYFEVEYGDITREAAALVCEAVADNPDKAENWDFMRKQWEKTVG